MFFYVFNGYVPIPILRAENSCLILILFTEFPSVCTTESCCTLHLFYHIFFLRLFNTSTLLMHVTPWFVAAASMACLIHRHISQLQCHGIFRFRAGNHYISHQWLLVPHFIHLYRYRLQPKLRLVKQSTDLSSNLVQVKTHNEKKKINLEIITERRTIPFMDIVSHLIIQGEM